MEENLDNNTNDFKPTKELGDLTLYAAGKAFGANKMWASIKNFTHFEDSTIWEIIDGTWTVKSDYIRLLAKCISTIRQKKVKLKRLPNTLPNRDVMESLENGLVDDFILYEKTIDKLCRMPDLPPKKPNKRRTASTKKANLLTKGVDLRTSIYHRQISAHNTLYNFSPCSPEFDYGLTDT